MMDYPTYPTPAIIDQIVGLNAPSTAVMVNASGTVWEIDGNGHGTPLSPAGFARDVGVAADGTVWIVGTEARPGGFAPSYLDRAAGKWSTFAAPVAVTRITGGPNGGAYGVNADGAIWHFTKQGKVVPFAPEHTAHDVGFAAGLLGIVSNQPLPGGFAIKVMGILVPPKWEQPLPTAAGERIAVAPDETIYVVNSDGEVWQINLAQKNGRRLTPEKQRFAQDIGIGMNETVWVITTEKREGGFAAAWLKDPGDAQRAPIWVTLPAPCAAVQIACR